ncbi:MAG: twin-arginine translocase TatA/TatE family subunit [Actinobacteria bacterium]|nr:twin-arginine translocase TatA/TatE family subunit [Actinomycetota bacterium]
MFSVSPAEMLTIAVIALLVFGPKRLPDIARKAGKLIRDIRDAASELTGGLEDEVRDALEPIEDARDSMRKAIAGIDRPAPTTGTAKPRPAPGGPSAPVPQDDEAAPDHDPGAPEGSDEPQHRDPGEAPGGEA